MADALIEVAVRVYEDFADRVTREEVLDVVARCRADLDIPSSAALPELVERLARQRLAGRPRAEASENSPAQQDAATLPG